MSIISEIFNIIHIDYMVSVILITWMLIKFCFPSTVSKGFKVRTSLITGVVLGVLLFLYDSSHYTPPTLLVSMLCAVPAYQWVLKQIFKKVGLDYRKNDPSLFKNRTK